MSKTTAGTLAGIWSLRLRTKHLSSAGEDFAKILVEKLGHLEAQELIEVDAAEGRRPWARMIRASTGEVLAELEVEPISPESDTKLDIM
jgi:hypothetical protein